MTSPVLRVSGLTKEFRLHGRHNGRTLRAVDDVSFTIPQGSVLGLVGESGCGKSTVVRLVTGLLEPTRGTVEFFGTDTTRARRDERKRLSERVQLVFQDPHSSLDPHMTVGRSVAEPLRIHRRFQEAGGWDHIRALVDRVGLAHLDLQQSPRQLSGGQKQRVAIARALAISPDLLVLDEPVSALDVSVQAQIINLIADLREELGLSYLFVAHDLAVVKHISDMVAVMYLGAIVETGPAPAVFGAPAHPYTRALLEAVPEPTPRQHLTVPLAGDIPSPMDLPRGCRFSQRCPLSKKLGQPEVCLQQAPVLSEIGNGHLAACHFAGHDS